MFSKIEANPVQLEQECCAVQDINCFPLNVVIHLTRLHNAFLMPEMKRRAQFGRYC